MAVNVAVRTVLQPSVFVLEPPGPIRPGSRKTKVRRTRSGQQAITVVAVRVGDSAHEWDDVVGRGLVSGSMGPYRLSRRGRGPERRWKWQDPEVSSERCWDPHRPVHP